LPSNATPPRTFQSDNGPPPMSLVPGRVEGPPQPITLQSAHRSSLGAYSGRRGSRSTRTRSRWAPRRPARRSTWSSCPSAAASARAAARATQALWQTCVWVADWPGGTLAGWVGGLWTRRLGGLAAGWVGGWVGRWPAGWATPWLGGRVTRWLVVEVRRVGHRAGRGASDVVRSQVAGEVWSALLPLTHPNPPGPSEARVVLGSTGGLPMPWHERAYGRNPGDAFIFDSRMPSPILGGVGGGMVGQGGVEVGWGRSTSAGAVRPGTARSGRVAIWGAWAHPRFRPVRIASPPSSRCPTRPSTTCTPAPSAAPLGATGGGGRTAAGGPPGRADRGVRPVRREARLAALFWVRQHPNVPRPQQQPQGRGHRHVACFPSE
jgi:hypothetical protein